MLNLTDPIFTLQRLFLAGLPPPAPGPNGGDSEPAGEGLGCEDYPTFQCSNG